LLLPPPLGREVPSWLELVHAPRERVPTAEDGSGMERSGRRDDGRRETPLRRNWPRSRARLPLVSRPTPLPPAAATRSQHVIGEVTRCREACCRPPNPAPASREEQRGRHLETAGSGGEGNREKRRTWEVNSGERGDEWVLQRVGWF
jgi:hypothetical protein